VFWLVAADIAANGISASSVAHPVARFDVRVTVVTDVPPHSASDDFSCSLLWSGRHHTDASRRGQVEDWSLADQPFVTDVPPHSASDDFSCSLLWSGRHHTDASRRGQVEDWSLARRLKKGWSLVRQLALGRRRWPQHVDTPVTRQQHRRLAQRPRRLTQ
jgi:hypothetical protein